MNENEFGTKIKVRDKSEKDMLIDHLNRINGQINGIKKMVEESRYCDDILTQISAVTGSLQGLGLTILDEHMKSCVKKQILSGNDEIIDEVMKTIKRMNH